MKTFEYNLYEHNEYEDSGKVLSQTNYTIEAEDEDDASDKLRRTEKILPSMRSALREKKMPKAFAEPYFKKSLGLSK